MNIHTQISKLIYYAKNNLLLDDLDEVYVRNRLMSIFFLNEAGEEEQFDTDEIDELVTPDIIVEPMLGYATEHNLVTPEKLDELYSSIMDTVALKPSEVYNTFDDLRRSNAQKAFDWLYDYGVKLGEIDPLFDKTERWEAKATKGKIEVLIDRFSEEETRKNSYPECRFCRENEGLSDRATMRTVPLEIADGGWFFEYSPRPCLSQQGYVINDEHKTVALDANLLGVMADFVHDYNRQFYVSATKSSHGHLLTGSKVSPMLKAPKLRSLKSTIYPYMSIEVPDWYVNVVRVSHTHREKTIECAMKLIEDWKNYDKADGEKFAYVVCRYLDQQYTFDIILRSEAARPKVSHANIKSSPVDVQDCLGLFTLPASMTGQIEQLENILSGQTPKDKLTGDLAVHQKMLDKIYKEQGGEPVSKLEARLNLHDEINEIAENALIDSRVMTEEELDKFVAYSLNK